MAAQPGAPGEPGATLCDEKGVPLPKVKPDKEKDLESYSEFVGMVLS